MPELPEVETVCRVMRRALVGQRIDDVEVVPDPIIFDGAPPDLVDQSLRGRTILSIGRKGKVWWIQTDQAPVMYGHLGMTGWIRELGAPTIRLKEHGEAPLDDDSGRPRFLKLMLTAGSGSRVALTDGRRLGRVWLGEPPEAEPHLKRLGPDALDALPAGRRFIELFAGRKPAIKALLMDQSILSGIGNWVADEVLYQSRIAPQRASSSLSETEYGKLRRAIMAVIKTAVEAGADDSKYPPNWLFHHRWGGSRGVERIGKHQILREQVGGRTTAWVPAIQH